MPRPLNIADRLHESARVVPSQRAVVFPDGRDRQGRVRYTQLTFRQLDELADRLARGLVGLGVRPGMKLVLMVRPSLEFIALTFAVFRAGAVCVLIDPGMGRSNIFRCLGKVEPDGFVAIPIVHVIRLLKRASFPSARFNVCVGRGVPGSGVTYESLVKRASNDTSLPQTNSHDPAAVIFTSGSTGPPKGVVYEHGMFDAQVDLLRDHYGIQPGEVDLPGFPLFALFNSAMQVTTIIPDMDPTKPAQVDPEKILEAIDDQGVTQAFGSPAIWNRIGRYCEQTETPLPTIRRILSAGAPVPNHVLQRMTTALVRDGADIFTPYGATECLPVASTSGSDVLSDTAEQTNAGAGTCVGRLFADVRVKVIEITDAAIGDASEITELPRGEIGEIIVQSRAATREYYREAEATARAKIPDGDSFWHRMGDVGYLDDSDRLWFCGRKAHIVETADGRMFTIRCEAIFNNHPRVYRSALVGVGEAPAQRPVIIVEPEPGNFPDSSKKENNFRAELLEIARGSELTRSIETILFHRSLPVDIRHNVKIFRKKLAVWAAEILKV